jgi:hypothetical protein
MDEDCSSSTISSITGWYLFRNPAALDQAATFSTGSNSLLRLAKVSQFLGVNEKIAAAGTRWQQSK